MAHDVRTDGRVRLARCKVAPLLSRVDAEESVKPAGRAIEIVAVGLGQAGGNLAAELYRRGYRAMALNTASTDLSALSHSSTLLPEEYRLHIGIEGYDGAGAD